MATKGLGKGLGALLSMFDDEAEEVIASTPKAKTPDILPEKVQTRAVGQTTASHDTQEPKGVREIDISLIDNNMTQPRKDFDPVRIQELSDSIKVNGVIQPILVKPIGTRFMIVAGERRWRATKLAGLKTIPALVRDLSPFQIAEIAIVENLQRQDLNEIELARGIQQLMKEFNLTQDQTAIRLGKNRSHIAHTLRLLTLPAEIIDLVEKGKLSAGHARCLVTIPNKEKAVILARKCVEENLSVRDLEKLVYGQKTAADSSGSSKKPQSLEIRDFARKLTSILSTKVSIQGDSQKGKVVIEYFTTQDLMRIRKKIIDINEITSVEEVLKTKPRI
jgi:ParB family chromosome partitioning protein